MRSLGEAMWAPYEKHALTLCFLIGSALVIQSVGSPPYSNASAAPGPGRLAKPDAMCVEWTDSCRVCKQSDDGVIACSNVGIACQLEPVRCVRHQSEPGRCSK